MIPLDASMPHWIEVGGLIAAIVICLFAFIPVLLSLAWAGAMVFLFNWIHEKSALIKKVRPQVDTINKASDAALQGEAPSEDEPAVVRVAAGIPVGIHKADKKVGQVSERVAGAVIEFRARTMQVKTVMKTFLLPGLMVRSPRARRADEGLTFKSPGYRELMKENLPAEPTEEPAGEEEMRAVTSGQLKHASSR